MEGPRERRVRDPELRFRRRKLRESTTLRKDPGPSGKDRVTERTRTGRTKVVRVHREGTGLPAKEAGARATGLRIRADFQQNCVRVWRDGGYPSRHGSMKGRISRAVIEVGFILFLFYANLLMGEYEHSGMGRTRGLAWAVSDILTAPNFVIGLVAAIVGYVVFEFLRKKLP
jgi:hypothetical protein